MTTPQAKERAETLISKYDTLQASHGMFAFRLYAIKCALIDIDHQIEIAKKCYQQWIAEPENYSLKTFKEMQIYSDLTEIKEQLLKMKG